MSDQTQPRLGCNYHGQMFGAAYPDACCIDGYLWDEDSCDAPGGPLSIGGDIPCPNCNAEAAAESIGEAMADYGEYATVDAALVAARVRVENHVSEMRAKWGFFEEPGQ